MLRARYLPRLWQIGRRYCEMAGYDPLPDNFFKQVDLTLSEGGAFVTPLLYLNEGKYNGIKGLRDASKDCYHLTVGDGMKSCESFNVYYAFTDDPKLPPTQGQNCPIRLYMLVQRGEQEASVSADGSAMSSALIDSYWLHRSEDDGTGAVLVNNPNVLATLGEKSAFVWGLTYANDNDENVKCGSMLGRNYILQTPDPQLPVRYFAQDAEGRITTVLDKSKAGVIWMQNCS